MFDFTFIVNLKVPGDKHEQKRPYIVYASAPGIDEAAMMVQKKYDSPLVFAAFQGRGTPLRGELYPEQT